MRNLTLKHAILKLTVMGKWLENIHQGLDSLHALRANLHFVGLGENCATAEKVRHKLERALKLG